MRKKKLPALSFFLFLFSITNAQHTRHYQFDHFSVPQGLSSTYVRKIIQDPYGMIWISTQDGLNRYDGKRFQLYNYGLPQKQAITGSDVRDLLIDKDDHLLWCISSYGGIDAIDYRTGRVVFSYDQSRDPGTKGVLFNSLYLYKKHLIIGSSAGLFSLHRDTHRLEHITLKKGGRPVPDTINIAQIQIDELGNLLALCNGQGIYLVHGLDRIDDYLPEDQLLPGSKHGINFFETSALSDHSWIASTNYGLLKIAISPQSKLIVDKNPYPQIGLTQGKEIYSCKQDKTGNLYLCTPDHLVKWKPGDQNYTEIKENTSRDLLQWLQAAYYVYLDDQDHLWLGCQQGLAFSSNRPSPFFKFQQSSRSEVRIRQAYSIYPLNDSLLLCCAQDGLFSINIGSGEIISIDPKKPYYYICKDVKGELIAGTTEGMVILKKHHAVPIENYYPAFKSFQKFNLSNYYWLDDSLVLLTALNHTGALVWNRRSNRVSDIDETALGLKLKGLTVNYLNKDSYGRTWILANNAVFVYDPRRKNTLQVSFGDEKLKKNYSIFFDVRHAGSSHYIASYGHGIIVLDSSLRQIKEITTAQGLSSNGVYKILPLSDSLLLISSNNGLSLMNTKSKEIIANYYQQDGLHTSTFEEMSGTVHNGMLYMGGVNGVSQIDPSLASISPAKPRVYLDEVQMKTVSGEIDSVNLELKYLNIPTDVFQTKISFVGIDYCNSSKLTYEYKIQELKTEWTSLGSQNFINPISIKPGTYTLLFRCSSDGKNWSDEPLRLILNFLPKWYQTLWFIVSIFILVLAILYALYRFRIHQIQIQQQIRREIAGGHACLFLLIE